MAKKPTRTALVKKLDKLFSEYIRRRNGEMVSCVTCGKRAHWKEMQAGHFMSRRHRATRWHEDNVQVQCVRCNMFGNGEQFRFGQWLGVEKANELIQLSNHIVKQSDFEIKELIDIYKEKLQKLNS